MHVGVHGFITKDCDANEAFHEGVQPLSFLLLLQGIHSHPKPGSMPAGFSGRGRFQTRGGRSLQVSQQSLHVLDSHSSSISRLPYTAWKLLLLTRNTPLDIHAFLSIGRGLKFLVQEYHAKAAANGTAPGSFSFDVNGRSTLLPIPTALQTRLVRGTGGARSVLVLLLTSTPCAEWTCGS